MWPREGFRVYVLQLFAVETRGNFSFFLSARTGKKTFHVNIAAGNTTKLRHGL